MAGAIQSHHTRANAARLSLVDCRVVSPIFTSARVSPMCAVRGLYSLRPINVEPFELLLLTTLRRPPPPTHTHPNRVHVSRINRATQVSRLLALTTPLLDQHRGGVTWSFEAPPFTDEEVRRTYKWRE